MELWQAFVLGLSSGVVATLIADNPQVRFHVEKALRKIAGRPLVSVSLSSFTNFCKNGLLLIHCIELKNCMWLTTAIPRVYFLSRGTFAYDAHAYKPFIYFRSHGLSGNKTDFTPNEVLKEYSNKIVAYEPDNPLLGMSISKAVPTRVVVICEAIHLDEQTQRQPMNHLKMVGELHAAVANPMPLVSPGAWWDMRLISEDFGFIDNLHIMIPKDLAEREPLGDSVDVFKMPERPPCLIDIDYAGFTWPLRFTVNDCKILAKRRAPGETLFEVTMPKIKKSPLHRRRVSVMKREIRIQ